jgi:hypothetical protein
MYLPDERGKMRAADADRDRVVGLLNTAYTEGRLSKDEYDAAWTAPCPRAPTPTWTRS